MSKRVLVIEDHEENRRILRLLLASAGIEMIEALTGEDGVAMAEKERPDLILMDIQLPDINGIAALKMIRSDERIAKTPVVAVSASAMPDEQQKIVASGFDSYVTKPINMKIFLETVERLAGKPKGR